MRRCGPGVLTVRLAHLFGQAVGLDPDAGMLSEGRRAAAEHKVMNIRWVQGLAEDLPAAAPGPYRLVTFGQSFHWTEGGGGGRGERGGGGLVVKVGGGPGGGTRGFGGPG